MVRHSRTLYPFQRKIYGKIDRLRSTRPTKFKPDF